MKQEVSIKEWVFNKLEKEIGIDEAINGLIIIQCESRWDVDVISNTYDLGLWQINRMHTDISNADKLDYKKATDWTINKFKADGSWQAWSCAERMGIK